MQVGLPMLTNNHHIMPLKGEEMYAIYNIKFLARVRSRYANESINSSLYSLRVYEVGFCQAGSVMLKDS